MTETSTPLPRTLPDDPFADLAADSFDFEFAEPEPIDPALLARHRVTAVIVSHDGARWLPTLVSALDRSSRLPDRIVAVDTASRDASPEILAETFGEAVVHRVDGRLGFGAAVQAGLDALAGDHDGGDEANRGRGGQRRRRRDRERDGDRVPAPASAPGDGDVEWVWLLHDDCAPEPYALEHLVDFVARTPDAAVVGPKVRGWPDGRQLLEVGLSVTGAGRRYTGLERREYDQGQHDRVKDVLAVGSAGLLVRRDVWDTLGGFDPHLPVFRDDLDFGWRANRAGYRVLVCPQAVVHHAEAAAHGRRRITVAGGRPHQIDRRHAIFTLLANARAGRLVWVLLRVLVACVLRCIGFLLGKLPALAWDEVVALAAVLVRPGRLIAARRSRRRAAGATGAVSGTGQPGGAGDGGADLRGTRDLSALFPPRGQQLRHATDSLLGLLGGRVTGHDVPGTRRHSRISDSEDEADAVETDGAILRLLTRPGVLLVAALAVAALFAARGLYGSGRLMGGALLPAPGGASALWDVYSATWHPVGLGSDTPAPPYLAVLAFLGSIALGKVPLIVDLLLLGAVPLAGITAWWAVTRLVESTRLRLAGATAYALLPVTTGAVAAGRIGTVAGIILLPVLARGAFAALGPPGAARPGPLNRSWALGLLLAITAAFVPAAWVVVLLVAVAGLATAYRTWRAAVRVVIVLAVPVVLLVPWSLRVGGAPWMLLAEAGLPGPRLSDEQLPAWSVLLAAPGGPGAAPALLWLGLLLAGAAALLRTDRLRRALAGWAVVLAGLLVGVVQARTGVSGPTLETPVAGWPGFASAVVALGLLMAAMPAAEGATRVLAQSSFGWRQAGAAAIAVLAVAGPVVSAGWWVVRGTGDPLIRRDPAVLPAYVASEAAGDDRIRTLVLDPQGVPEDAAGGLADAGGAAGTGGGTVRYALLRDSGPRLGDGETGSPASAYGDLDAVVADLLSGRGSADVAALASFAVRYVYLPDARGADSAAVVSTLDTIPSLVRSSAPEGAVMWRVEAPVARLTVREAPAEDGAGADGTGAGGAGTGGAGSGTADAPPAVTLLPSDRVSAEAEVPPATGTGERTVVLAERADAGWAARLDDLLLDGEVVDGWAQGFALPVSAASPGGGVSAGHLTLRHEDPARGWFLLGQLGALVVVVVLGLPGVRRDQTAVDDVIDIGGDDAGPGSRRPVTVGVRARRLAARRGGRAGRPGRAGKRTAGHS